MIRSLLSAASLLFLSGICLSQSREQGPPVSAAVQSPTIKVESRIVVVDVVVTDKQGQSVPGIRKDDFHVSEDGGAQIVTSFEEHKGAAPNEMKLPPMPPNVFSNFPTARGADSVNLLLLDLLNTQPQNQAFVRQQVIKYLGEVRPAHASPFSRSVLAFAWCVGSPPIFPVSPQPWKTKNSASPPKSLEACRLRLTNTATRRFFGKCAKVRLRPRPLMPWSLSSATRPPSTPTPAAS